MITISAAILALQRYLKLLVPIDSLRTPAEPWLLLVLRPLAAGALAVGGEREKAVAKAASPRALPRGLVGASTRSRQWTRVDHGRRCVPTRI